MTKTRKFLSQAGQRRQQEWDEGYQGEKYAGRRRSGLRSLVGERR